MALSVDNLVKAGMWKLQADVLVAGSFTDASLAQVGFPSPQRIELLSLGSATTASLVKVGFWKNLADALKE